MAAAKKGAGATGNKGKKPAAEKRVRPSSGGGAVQKVPKGKGAVQKMPKGPKGIVNKQANSGLVFPIGRILRMMREGRYAEKVSVRAAVYMAAVLEYLTAEVLEVAGNSAKHDKKMRITPRHIVAAIHNDDELSNLFRGATIIEGGVNPSAIVQVKRSKKAKEERQEEADSDDEE